MELELLQKASRTCSVGRIGSDVFRIGIADLGSRPVFQHVDFRIANCCIAFHGVFPKGPVEKLTDPNGIPKRVVTSDEGVCRNAAGDLGPSAGKMSELVHPVSILPVCFTVVGMLHDVFGAVTLISYECGFDVL